VATSSVLYAGETILLAHTATFDGEDLTDANTDSVTITIFDDEAEEFLAETPMVWSSTDARWEYWWDTTEAGKFTCKVIVTTTNGVSWEVFKVTIKTSPV